MSDIAHVGCSIRALRGKRVILDRDLAQLYGVEVGSLNRAVKRNIDRFPGDFMFQLTAVEASASRCQSGILNRGQNFKYLPYAFTEQGV
ncbi:ORF6N domain-containing protein, partial [bacterium]